MGSIIDVFRENEPDGRVIVGGDFNMDKEELELLKYESGVATLLRMGVIETGPTQRTRKGCEQQLRQIDYIFADFPLKNTRKLIDFNSFMDNDHACLVTEIGLLAPRPETIMPSKEMRRRIQWYV
jgi:endonuclease/exonuclease/phosphatase family metal-dependent hydrolase